MAALVFDMDGLLLNTENLYDLVLNGILSETGQSFDRESKQAMMGRPASDALAYFRNRFGLTQTIEQLIDRCEADLFGLLPTHLELMPGVSRVLELAEQYALPCSVATSSRRTFAEIALRQAGILDRFRFLICGAEVARGKPHPDIYLASAERLSIEPERMIVFEDSVAGSRAAVASGACTVVVPGPHNQGQQYSGHRLNVETIDHDSVIELVTQLAVSR